MRQYPFTISAVQIVFECQYFYYLPIFSMEYNKGHLSKKRFLLLTWLCVECIVSIYKLSFSEVLKGLIFIMLKQAIITLDQTPPKGVYVILLYAWRLYTSLFILYNCTQLTSIYPLLLLSLIQLLFLLWSYYLIYHITWFWKVSLWQLINVIKVSFNW